MSLTHKGASTLKTKNLILRPFKIEDAQHMFNNWASDEKVTKFLSWQPHTKVENTKSLLTDWVKKYENNNYYHWAIEIDNMPVGSIAAVALDEKNHNCEIGFCISYNYWGKGFVAEALSELMRYFFCEVGMNRISAEHYAENINSGKVMQKCGMTYEGRKKEKDLKHDGIYSDSIIYGITFKEWSERYGDKRK